MNEHSVYSSCATELCLHLDTHRWPICLLECDACAGETYSGLYLREHSSLSPCYYYMSLRIQAIIIRKHVAPVEKFEGFQATGDQGMGIKIRDFIV